MGGCLPWAYSPCRFYLPSAGGVLGYFVPVRPDVTCVGKSADSSWSDPQTGTHRFGHFLENRPVHVAYSPPTLDAGDWSPPDQKCTVYHARNPTRNFPTAGWWQVQPHAVSVAPPPLHLHLWHYLGNTAVYVPMQHIAQRGIGEMLYWFHHGVYLPEQVRWPAFVKRQSASCYVIDLPLRRLPETCRVTTAGLCEVHRFLAGYTGHAPTPSPVP